MVWAECLELDRMDAAFGRAADEFPCDLNFTFVIVSDFRNNKRCLVEVV